MDAGDGDTHAGDGEETRHLNKAEQYTDADKEQSSSTVINADKERDSDTVTAEGEQGKPCDAGSMREDSEQVNSKIVHGIPSDGEVVKEEPMSPEHQKGDTRDAEESGTEKQTVKINENEEIERREDAANKEHELPVQQEGTEEASDQAQELVGDDEASEDTHMYKLGKICRICAEMTVVFDGPKKGVPKHEIVKHVRKVWNVDLSDEDPDIYPVNVCQYCERKIKRLYLKVSKKKKCEFYRDKPADFVAHTAQNCSVCLLKDDQPDSPCNPAAEEAQQVGTVEARVGSQGEGSQANKIILPSTEPRRNPARKRGWTDHEAETPQFVSVGCQTEEDGTSENMTGLEEHDYTQDEALSQFLVIPKKFGGRTPYHKLSLTAVNAKYIRQDRLKPLIAHIDKFCQVQKENKIDAMFFLLMEALRDAGDRVRETQVEDIWCRKNNVGMSLTDEECLAKRILLKQTKDQYRKEYSYYKEKLEKAVLKPPFIIDKLEKTYFPEYLEFFVTEGETGPIIYQHEKRSHPSYFAISGSAESNSKLDSNYAGVVGARWHYFDAVAKTLEELAHSLENEIHELDDDSCIQVDLLDYCEEKRDLTNFGDKNDSAATGRCSQSKMMTYFFGIQTMQAIIDNKIHYIYKSNPNNVQFRPLMKALVAEGNTLRPTIRSIEEERATMSEKVFYITLPGGTPLRFMVYFANATLEIRKDYRNISGLTLSSFKKVPAVINRYGNICLELKRSWLATSPRLIHVGRVTNCRTKCSRCGEQGHNVRKCTVKSENVSGDSVIHHRKRKKQRSVPAHSYPVALTQNTYSQVYVKDSKIVDLCNPHPHPQQPQQHQEPEEQDPLSQLTTVANPMDQGNAVIRSDEQILWTCPSIGGGSQPLSGTALPATQVLVPSSVSTNAEYQTGSHRSQAQASQGTSGPVYVWTYTVVQPQHGSSQQPAQQLSLIPQQNPQQGVTQQSQQLSVIHPQSGQQGTSQEQITVVHQQPVHQGAAQQIAVVHQPAGQQAANQQTQQLSVIHPQTSQHAPVHPSHVVPHQQQARRTSQEQQAQHVTLIQQQAGLPQAQPLTLVHQQPTTQTSQQISVVHQPQTSQQLSIVHQHQTSQAAASLVHQQPNQSQGTQHQTESSQSQSPSSELRVTPNHWYVWL
ncbi:hypothetical protein C7M84_022783 [Penaeus vannamei]|uniref:V(D)J recombination-activating protein 1 n=1 Tax=Penaeus vannamei TaxID=6689 RepID=A0A3R7QMP7_PENVA|nr:hypothetical protein C7M84_022783 [Penaeus vannamei]